MAVGLNRRDAGDNIRAWLDEFHFVRKRHDVVVHGLGAAHQKIIADSFAEMEPVDYFAATAAAEESNFAKWEEFNGAGSAPKLDASEAQKLLAPAIAKLADEIFGKGTYDKIAAI